MIGTVSGDAGYVTLLAPLEGGTGLEAEGRARICRGTRPRNPFPEEERGEEGEEAGGGAFIAAAS